MDVDFRGECLAVIKLDGYGFADVIARFTYWPMP